MDDCLDRPHLEHGTQPPDEPLRGWPLAGGVAVMVTIAVLIWPAALSYGAAILASPRQRYRTVAKVGIGLGLIGVVVTVVGAVIAAQSP